MMMQLYKTKNFFWRVLETEMRFANEQKDSIIGLQAENIRNVNGTLFIETYVVKLMLAPRFEF